MYFTGTMNIVKAVNAVTGKLIWEYDPKVAEHVGKRNRVGWVHNRGISFYEWKVFAATWDGRLIGIDAKTGKELWSTMTLDPEKALYNRCAQSF
jgi:quinohemoprotein ethanol dehydrogenase